MKSRKASLILCFPSSLLRLLCPAVQLSSSKRSMGRRKLWRALMWSSRTPSCFLREADRCDPLWKTLFHPLPVIHHRAYPNIHNYLCCSFQPDDHGIIGDVPVLRVTRQGPEAVHFVTSPLEEGQEVKVKVDWERRFDHMQQHSGEWQQQDICINVCLFKAFSLSSQVNI